MGGLGNVGDNVFEAPGGTYRGMSMRAFDPARHACGAAGGWTVARRGHRAAVSGSFDKGIGTLIGDDVIGGEKVQVRSQWSACHAALGTLGTGHFERWPNWEPNWIAELERASG